MEKLELYQMENVEGGKWGARQWLELGCVSGGIALALLSGPAFALTASVTIHVCAGYFLTKATL